MAQEYTTTNDPNFAFTWLFLNSEATAGLFLVGADIAGAAGVSAGVEGDGGAVGGIEAGVYVLDPAQVNEIMIILRGIFKDAKADNICSDSPIDAIDNLSLGDREDPDPFTRSEIEKILSTPTRRTPEINMMGFAFWSGLGISELIALAWEDIDLRTGTVKVCRARANGSYKQTKTKRSTREVELIDPAIQWLQVQRLFTERLDTRRLKIMSRYNKKQFSEDVRLVSLNSNTKRPHESDGTVQNNFWRAHL